MGPRFIRFARQAALRLLMPSCACLTTLALLGASPRNELSPEFSTRGGLYTNDLRVELKTSAPSTIRFTTDGSEPSSNSPEYTSAIEVANCVVLRARAFYRDGRASRTVSQSYVILADDLRRFTSNLPLVVINSSEGEIDSRAKLLSGLHVLENKPERTTLPDRADFAGLALLNLRGFSSLRYPKHSFSVKTVNEQREPQKAPILGLPAESDWVLYGPYPDKTLLRDVLAYDLSRAMGHWAPRTRFVEVFLMETRGRLSMENYVGVYVLEEKVIRDKSRVNIAKLDASHSREPEISGGYIFKKDHAARGERRRFDADGPPMAAMPMDRGGFPTPAGGFPGDPAGFLPPFSGGSSVRGFRTQSRVERISGRNPGPRLVTNYVAAVVRESSRFDAQAVLPEEEGFRTALQGNSFYYVEPEPDELSSVQRGWLKSYVNRFEAALYGADFADARLGYPAFIDRDSFIDYHLFSEITKNVDAFRFSTFYYKDRGGLLKMGPVWDWNLSFGNADGKQGYMPERWLWPQLNDQEYSWFRRLFEDPDFAQRYVDRWAQLRTNIFATSNVLARIDALAAHLGEAQARNFARWEILGREVNPNYFVGQTYEEEIDWMKKWTSNRLAWIEAQFVPAPQVEAGAQLVLTTSAADGQIYFTVDGSDPRAPGGEVSAAAKAFQSPMKLTRNSKLVARVRQGTRWSPPILVP